MIVCRTLGPVELLIAETPAPAELLWRKNLALLVYLARSPKRARTREHLIGLLWGDKPEAAARHSLNEALRTLRRHMGEAAVESQGDQVRLSEDAVQIDLDRFEDLMAEEEWSAAGALVAGEFMEGFFVPGCSEFENWLSAERRIWRGRGVEALVRQAEGELGRGDVRAARETVRRALALDPTSGLAARTGIRSAALAGDRSAALELYEAFSVRLEEELGIEPDLETRALAERVRRERAWQPPDRLAAEELEAAGARRAPMVGRDAELGRFLDLWAECRTLERPAIALVIGDPGAGKTRLGEEVLARARLDGAVVARVRAVEADRGAPWSGALALTGGLAELGSVVEAAAAGPAARATGLAEGSEPRPGPEQGPESTPGQVLSQVLASVVSEGPLFLWLDDAHWVDRETLLSLEALVRDLADHSLFVLLTATEHAVPSEIDELRARIGRDLAGLTISLRPLNDKALRTLARNFLPGYGEAELDRLTRRVATDSAGLPLLAVELLHAVALGLDLHETAGAWPEPSRTLDQTLPSGLPDAVVAAIRVGFRRLSPDAQSVLSAAAVLGDRTTVEMLTRATGLEDGAIGSALDELEWARWLTAEPRGFSFVARIVREVVARDMVTAARRQRILEACRASAAD